MDQRLRDLERQAAQGDRSAQERLLRERFRLDLLGKNDLRLAAYLGDPTAAELLGDATPERDGGWPRGVDRWGTEAGVRVALAAARFAACLEPRGARSAVGGLLAKLRRNPQTRARAVVEAIDAWLLEPSRATHEAIEAAARGIGDDADKRLRAARAAADAVLQADMRQARGEPQEAAGEAALHAGHAALEAKLAVPTHPELPVELFQAPLEASDWRRYRDVYGRVDWGEHQRAEEAAAQQVAAAIRDEVVAWAVTPRE